jgi:hypothetical protein
MNDEELAQERERAIIFLESLTKEELQALLDRLNTIGEE